MAHLAWWCIALFTSTVLVNVESLTTADLLPYGATHGDTKLQGAETPYTSIGGEKKFRYGTKNVGEFRVSTNGSVDLRDGETYVTGVYPYAADVESTTGDVWYRVTEDASQLENMTSQILSISQYIGFTAELALVVTWEGMSFLGADDDGKKKKNTFQMAVVGDGEGSETFVILSYVRLDWSTGHGVTHGADPSTGLGETHTAAACLRGYCLPRSNTSDVLQLAKMSNTNTPGRWIYRISDKNIQSSEGAGATNCTSGDCPGLYYCESDTVGGMVTPGACYCPTTQLRVGDKCYRITDTVVWMNKAIDDGELDLAQLYKMTRVQDLKKELHDSYLEELKRLKSEKPKDAMLSLSDVLAVIARVNRQNRLSPPTSPALKGSSPAGPNGVTPGREPPSSTTAQITKVQPIDGPKPKEKSKFSLTSTLLGLLIGGSVLALFISFGVAYFVGRRVRARRADMAADKPPGAQPDAEQTPAGDVEVWEQDVEPQNYEVQDMTDGDDVSVRSGDSDVSDVSDVSVESDVDEDDVF